MGNADCDGDHVFSTTGLLLPSTSISQWQSLLICSQSKVTRTQALQIASLLWFKGGRNRETSSLEHSASNATCGGTLTQNICHSAKDSINSIVTNQHCWSFLFTCLVLSWMMVQLVRHPLSMCWRISSKSKRKNVDRMHWQINCSNTTVMCCPCHGDRLILTVQWMEGKSTTIFLQWKKFQIFFTQNIVLWPQIWMYGRFVTSWLHPNPNYIFKSKHN